MPDNKMVGNFLFKMRLFMMGGREEEAEKEKLNTHTYAGAYMQVWPEGS